jgi:hypothetical protein
MSNASSGQNCARPGVASTFPNFDTRTSVPTKGSSNGIAGSPAGGGIQHDKGPFGVLGQASDTSYVKSGGNPCGGSGGNAC